MAKADSKTPSEKVMLTTATIGAMLQMPDQEEALKATGKSALELLREAHEALQILQHSRLVARSALMLDETTDDAVLQHVGTDALKRAIELEG